MIKEDALRSKVLYKLLLVSLKIIPMLITASYMLNTALAYIDIDIPVLSNISGMSLLTWLFMLLASIVFKFCSYHRMFLYYIGVTDCINIADYYFDIPISTFSIIMIHGIIAGISLFIILHLYVKNHKKLTTRDSRKNRFR